MSRRVTVTIDGKKIQALAGEKLLWVALENGIFIPNLCALKGQERPPASCRLCFVQVKGKEEPVTACTLPVVDGMEVKTRSPQVDRLVKSAFELLLSHHRLQCSRCPKNKNCQLQIIARERGLKLKLNRLKPLSREEEIDDSAESYALDRSRCVLCGRCVWVDRHAAKTGTIGFAQRGIARRVATFGDEGLGGVASPEFQRCVEVCPVGALYFKKKEERGDPGNEK
jgi:NADH dehydrogenase/NADH:ubiquinone oxidoreductase subunit G